MADEPSLDDLRATLASAGRARVRSRKALEAARKAAPLARAAGLNVTEIANLAGVSRQTVHDWLRRTEDDDG